MITSASASLPQSFWRPVAVLPVGTAGFGRGVIGGKLFVAGGTTWEGERKLLPTDVWRYDPATNRWTTAGLLPRSFSFGVSCVHDASLLLFGGDDGEQTREDGIVFNADGAIGTAATLPRPTAYAGFASDSSGCFLLGGTLSLRALDQSHAAFFRFDPISGRTEFLPDYPEGPVIHAALAVAGGNVFAFPGGLRTPEGTIRNSQAAWRYEIASAQWKPLAPFPHPVRGLAAKALNAEYILLAGGLKSTPATTTEITGDCYLYDIRHDRYLALPALPHGVMLIGLETIEGEIFAFGGEDRAKHRSAHVFRATISSLIEFANSTQEPRASGEAQSR